MYKAGPSAQETLLAYFVNLDEQELVKLLLEHDAKASYGDRFGWTPLMDAVHNQNLAMIELLLPSSDPRIKSKLEITINDQDIKETGVEYPVIDAMGIAERIETDTGKQIVEAIQKRLNVLDPAPSVPVPAQFNEVMAEIRRLRTEFEIAAVLALSNEAIELLSNEKIDKSTDNKLVGNAIYLLLYKHEAGVAAGEKLNESDMALASKLINAGSNAQKWHDMLDILDTARSASAQAEIDAWENTYGIPEKELWDFDFLARWIDSNEDESVRDRLYDTLDYFELR